MAERLPAATTLDDAFNEVVRALARLGVASGVMLIEADVAVFAAAQIPQAARTLLSRDAASRLVGTRVPVDGIPSIRQTVRLRRPYFGPAQGMDTLRSVITDTGLGQVLPSAGAEDTVLMVPVSAHDRVVAVVTALGEEVDESLAPLLEAVAVMLASAWSRQGEPMIERFAGISAGRPSPQVRSALIDLIDGQLMTAAMQPIVRLYDQAVIGYESLSRFPPSAQFRTPDQLFSAASALHLESRVDLACVRAALRESPNVGDVDLFVNVLIRTLLDPRGMRALQDAVRDAGVDPSTIVLEFSERDPVPDLARLQRIAAELRSYGFRIAVDDAGAGHASMRVIAELRPEFIKIDRSLIHAIDTDRARRALVVALLSFGGHIGARLIAEGVETPSEEEVLSSLGVQFAQGWQLGRPVLLQPVVGHETTQVVDAAWFASRRASRIRDLRREEAPATAAVASTPAANGSARRRGLARALSDAALALQSEHDTKRILGVMAEQMRRVVPVREMAIYAADYETHRFVPLYATGEDVDAILADSFALDAGITGWAFTGGTPEIVTDTAGHPSARQVPGTPVVHESMLVVPLVAGERKLGIINCWRLGIGQFSPRELEAATLFAHVAATAWRNAQLYSELVNAAMTDPLTSLYNSRWLRDTVERDLTRSRRDGTSLALLLVDLDHFKSVNDSGGHASGDLVLQRVAARLRGAVRGADAVVRLGGEEFVLLLHGCDAHGALNVAEAVRRTLHESPLPEGCSLRRITASIGVAVYPEHGSTLDQLLGAADRAMYDAKHRGRDCVALAEVRQPTVVPLDQRREPGRRHAAGA